jgi:hypothetical protein
MRLVLHDDRTRHSQHADDYVHCHSIMCTAPPPLCAPPLLHYVHRPSSIMCTAPPPICALPLLHYVHCLSSIMCTAPPTLCALWFKKTRPVTEQAETEARHCTSTWPSPIKLPSYKPIYISGCYPTISFPHQYSTCISCLPYPCYSKQTSTKKGNLKSAQSYQMSTQS